MNMQIVLNGKSRLIEDNVTVGALVAELNLPGKRYAVEINQEIIPRTEHDSRRLEAGDSVEIVQAIGGG